jgi:hypothetical protein
MTALSMLIEQYLMKAHGEGDLEQSPVFQGTMDWLFEVIYAGYAGYNFDPQSIGDQADELTRLRITSTFDIRRYTTLHDFMFNESVIVTYDIHRPQVDEKTYLVCEAIPEAIKLATISWLKRENAINGVDQGTIYGFATFVCTGLLGSLFTLPMHDGLFEQAMVKRCITTEHQAVFGQFYGYEKAAKLFPKSKARGKWLEEALGI